jgi:hypothetical protein
MDRKEPGGGELEKEGERRGRWIRGMMGMEWGATGHDMTAAPLRE